MNKDRDFQETATHSNNSISLALGISATVIGPAGLVASFIPQLAKIAVPVAIFGLVLSVCGIGFACSRRFRSIGMPILGCLLCTAAVSITLISNYNKEAEAKRRAEARAETEKTLANMQDSLLDKQTAFLVAQTNLTVAQTNYDRFMAAKPWVTNSTYAEAVARLNNCINRRNGLAQAVGIMRQDYNSQVANSYTYNNGPKRNVVLVNRDSANPSRQAEMSVDQVTVQYDRQEVANLDQQIPQM